MKTLLVIAVLVILSGDYCRAQVPGVPPGSTTPPAEGSRVPKDTLFIFQPARPLIDTLGITGDYRDGWGFDLLFSNSGFGVGGYYERRFSPKLTGFIDLGVTGSRKTDEFDRPVRTSDPDFPYDYRVPNKVNRLYTFPLTVGVRYRLLEEVLVDNFRPYVNAGVGPSMIVALPYDYEFFSSIPHASFHFTGGGFVGVGAEIGKRPAMGVNVRYYYIPFKSGLESLRDDPITDFGGLFLTMNIGFGH
jgi:hypothetical protein